MDVMRYIIQKVVTTPMRDPFDLETSLSNIWHVGIVLKFFQFSGSKHFVRLNDSHPFNRTGPRSPTFSMWSL